MREVLQALRFNDVAVVRVRLHEDALEGVHLGQMGDGHSGMRVGEPDAVAAAKARMSVNAQTEAA